MLGYMTEKEAKKNGFTHHGSYYGIPVWIGDVHGDFQVATKWAPLEWLMTGFHYIEGFMFPYVHGWDAQPMFMFKLKCEIK